MSHQGRFVAPDYVRRIVPYRPGRPTISLGGDSARLDREPCEICELASNENPHGPSPRAIEAMAASLASAFRYPDGGGYQLRCRLASRLGVTPEAIALGNGSAELVDLLCKTFVTDGQCVVVSRYGFVQYRLSAQAINAKVIDVAPVEGRLADDLLAMAQAANAHQARIVFIANPNNPTGTYATREQLDGYFAAVDPSILTVIDQAYFEYADPPDYPDGMDDLAAGRNVVVLRTFSKIHGLASLRIGYGIGSPELWAQLDGVRLPFNTGALAQVAACAALEDGAHVERCRRINRVEREFLEAQLRSRALAYLPSIGNFLMVDLQGPAEEIHERLLRLGVLVRPLAGYGLATWQRITVGTRAQNETLLRAIDTLRVTARAGHDE